MNKKKYEGLEVEVVRLLGEDIITASGCVTTFDVINVDPGPNDMLNTTDIQGLAGYLGIAEGFYSVAYIEGLFPLN